MDPRVIKVSGDEQDNFIKLFKPRLAFEMYAQEYAAACGVCAKLVRSLCQRIRYKIGDDVIMCTAEGPDTENSITRTYSLTMDPGSHAPGQRYSIAGHEWGFELTLERCSSPLYVSYPTIYSIWGLLIESRGLLECMDTYHIRPMFVVSSSRTSCRWSDIWRR